MKVKSELHKAVALLEENGYRVLFAEKGIDKELLKDTPHGTIKLVIAPIGQEKDAN